MHTPVAAQAQDAVRGVQQRLGRRPTEIDQHFWIDQLDLPFDEGAADLGLVRRRSAIARRAPWNDVGYIGGCPVEADCREHLVEQPARAADEGQAFEVLVAARRFADQHQVGVRIAVGKDQVLGGEFEVAAVEGPHVLA